MNFSMGAIIREVASNRETMVFNCQIILNTHIEEFGGIRVNEIVRSECE